MTLPSRYGVGLAPYRAIPGDELVISLVSGGVNVSKPPHVLDEGESPNAVDVRFGDGGVSTDYGLSLLGTAYAGGADKTIIHMAEFTRKILPTTNRLVRMRPTGWDRWDGASWVTLGGTALNGISTDRLYSVAMQDRLVAANKVDKLKSWDGQDASNVIDLSADAPVAWFIAAIGQRLVAARVKSGADVDPYLIKWCADGLITDWTTANLGAGAATLEPEGRGGGPDFIMGLSALETALVVFRQRSIVLGVRTGIGAAPFRFTTTVFNLGTEAPYTVASPGKEIGTLFLGNDLNVYLFNANGAPIPVGDPIRLLLKSQIQDPSLCVGAVDVRNSDYWLLVKRSGALPDIAWVLNLRELVLNRRVVWRRRNLATGYASVAFGKTALQANPVVNAVNIIVDTIGTRVDDYGLSLSPERVIFGDGTGGVWYSDETKFLTTGSWESKMLGSPNKNQAIDRVFLMCQAPVNSSIELSISDDGGETWSNPKVINIPANNYAQPVGTWFNLVLARWQFRIRILSGNVTISEIKAESDARGPVAA